MLSGDLEEFPFAFLMWLLEGIKRSCRSQIQNRNHSSCNGQHNSLQKGVVDADYVDVRGDWIST